MKPKKPKRKLPICHECKNPIQPEIDHLGNEANGVAWHNCKKVCQLCFWRLKHQSKTRCRPATLKVWEEWIRMSEANEKE